MGTHIEVITEDFYGLDQILQDMNEESSEQEAEIRSEMQNLNIPVIFTVDGDNRKIREAKADLKRMVENANSNRERIHSSNIDNREDPD